MRTHLSAVGDDALVLETGHPCSGALAFAREEVGIYHSEITAVGILYIVGLHVGMIDLDVGIRLKCQSVEFCSQSENTVYHIVKFKIGTKFLLVIAVLGLL